MSQAQSSARVLEGGRGLNGPWCIMQEQRAAGQEGIVGTVWAEHHCLWRALHPAGAMTRLNTADALGTTTGMGRHGMCNLG